MGPHPCWYLRAPLCDRSLAAIDAAEGITSVVESNAGRLGQITAHCTYCAAVKPIGVMVTALTRTCWYIPAKAANLDEVHNEVATDVARELVVPFEVVTPTGHSTTAWL